jgi:hypothetical protein
MTKFGDLPIGSFFRKVATSTGYDASRYLKLSGGKALNLQRMTVVFGLDSFNNDDVVVQIYGMITHD